MTEPTPTSESDPRTAEKLASLHAATREMMHAESREAVAGTATSAATDVLGFSLNTVRLYDPDTERLLPTATSPSVERLAGERRPYERGETVQWRAFDDLEVLTFGDVTEIDDDVPRTGEGSMLVAPLGEHGVITLGSARPDDIDRADVELSRVLAANVETAMDRAERRSTLRKRTERLEQQNERLDRFASIVSHDLRNPLNVAAGNVSLVQQTGSLERLDQVADALDRIDGLVDSMLALAREGKTVENPTTVDVAALAEAAWNTVVTGEASLVVENDIEVKADRERLRTLLENCFRNGVEHAGANATVTVESIESAAEEGFAIADDGPGIPAGKREDVFERGYTTDGTGTGFGLAIVREIAHAHGWSVSVTESETGGARFEFILTR